jgi:tetratricopeptide (TPR) repeat protein
MGRAASEIISADLGQARDVAIVPTAAIHRLDAIVGPRPIAAPGISAERTDAELAGATQIVYGQIAMPAGKLRIDASIEDLKTQRMVHTLSSEADSSGKLLAAADQIAREISAGAQPFPTRDPRAIEAYVKGREAPPPQAGQYFERAVQADPNFGLAWVAWERVAAARQDRAAFDEILARAQARGNAIPEIDRAYMLYDAAALRGDIQARLDAMETLSRLMPADTANLRTLAEAEVSARRFGPAIQHFHQVLAMTPSDPDTWNLLGYAEAFAGNYAEAVKALNEYQRLRPQDANPLDSLGDVNFYFDKLAEAESDYLKAQEKEPKFLQHADLLKAAHARLMTGDVAGADQIFARYREALRAAQDALLGFREAEWLYLTGRRNAGVQTLTQFISRATDVNAKTTALAQLGVWKLASGDRAGARSLAVQALKIRTPQNVLQSALLLFLSQDAASAEEWKTRAERFFVGPNNDALRRQAVAEALLFSKRFADAAPLWKEVYQQSVPTDQATPVLYAWTLVETGHVEEAAPLLRFNPIPQVNTASPVTTLWFPRIFELRAMVAEKQGRSDDALRNRKIFAALTGGQ